MKKLSIYIGEIFLNPFNYMEYIININLRKKQ